MRCRRLLGLILPLLSPIVARAQATLPYSSLDAYVVDVVAGLPRAGTEAFVEPSAGDLAAFEACAVALLAGDVATATACLDPLGYDLLALDDAGLLRRYLVAQERIAGSRGLGTFIVDPEWHRNAVFAAPHPLFDTNTAVESRRIFQELRARALVIAGTHRCANAAPSGCDGASTVCGDGVYHVSDVAHFTRTFVQAFHAALGTLDPAPMAFSMHGNVGEPVDVELSDGTNRPRPWTAPVILLRDELLWHGISAGSCNWPLDAGLSLCGTTNVQGRLLNGSPDPCGTPTSNAMGRFIHVEQRRWIRDDPTGLILALDEGVDADGILLRASRSGTDVVLDYVGGAPEYRIVRGDDARLRIGRVERGSPGTAFTDIAPAGGTLFYDVR